MEHEEARLRDDVLEKWVLVIRPVERFALGASRQTFGECRADSVN